jgi:release factor glutamine methyltransferase
MEISIEGIRLLVPDSVYPPAEDSFMLAHAAKALRGHILEIGCGSGIASLSCAKADSKNSVLGLDMNPEAVSCASENAERNGIKNARFIQSDLFSSLSGGRFDEAEEKRFDAILFNPPYLPTSEEERLKGEINRAYDGGKDGRETLDRFLSSFDPFLKPGGTLLLVQSSLNDPKKTEQKLASLGYKVEKVAQESFFFERLFLFRAIKP